MDRNTIIAIILCVIVITIGMTFQQSLMSNNQDVVDTTETVDTTDDIVYLNNPESYEAQGSVTDGNKFTVTTPSLAITFDPKGGTIDSVHDEKNDVNLVIKEDDDDSSFMMYWGDDKTSAIDDLFAYSIEEKSIAGKSDKITQVTFTRSYKETATGKLFTIEKRYAVPENDEYMIQLAVSIYTEDGSVIPVSLNNAMYTLSVGSQVGPEFESLNGNYDYRRVYYKLANKNNRKTVNSGSFTSYNEMDWVGVVGKYFAYLLIPETKGIINKSEAVQEAGTTIPQKNIIYMTRQASSVNKTTDVFSFYCGPQLSSTLGIYDKANNNIFGLENHNLKKALDVSWLSWLETILKYALELFYFLIPNYGVAIILLTILVKLILIPISKKGTDSTAKMSALQPKMKEIQEKYKDDPQAQNAAVAKLYKEEGINPMGSCIPMLIQFPIFIGLYGLLNKDFSLRGAMFIPGWIPDLSIPETIFTLPFNLPLLGSQIHLLPIIYTVSMILSMKITQSTTSTSSGSKGMTWFMTYGMSIIFFFVLYNAPSGLLVYWTMSNALSIIQQVITNKKKVAGYKEEIAEKDAQKAQKKAAKKNKR